MVVVVFTEVVLCGWFWCCCVRYKIGSVLIAKATGGAISFYNGKTIHTFTTTGDFNNTRIRLETVKLSLLVVVVEEVAIWR